MLATGSSNCAADTQNGTGGTTLSGAGSTTPIEYGSGPDDPNDPDG